MSWFIKKIIFEALRSRFVVIKGSSKRVKENFWQQCKIFKEMKYVFDMKVILGNFWHQN